MQNIINKTIELMSFFGFKTRDTFDLNYNYDDMYVNDGYLNGPRHFHIVWGEYNCPGINGECYQLPDRESLSYNQCRIEMPERYRTQNRDDVFYHETTHFLQRNTQQDESNYISFNGRNYPEYVSQQSEYEAHLVQIKFIFDEMNDYLLTKIDEGVAETIRNEIAALSNSALTKKTNGVSLIIKLRELDVL